MVSLLSSSPINMTSGWEGDAASELTALGTTRRDLERAQVPPHSSTKTTAFGWKYKMCFTRVDSN